MKNLSKTILPMILLAGATAFATGSDRSADWNDDDTGTASGSTTGSGGTMDDGTVFDGTQGADHFGSAPGSYTSAAGTHGPTTIQTLRCPFVRDSEDCTDNGTKSGTTTEDEDLD